VLSLLCLWPLLEPFDTASEDEAATETAAGPVLMVAINASAMAHRAPHRFLSARMTGLLLPAGSGIRERAAEEADDAGRREMNATAADRHGVVNEHHATTCIRKRAPCACVVFRGAVCPAVLRGVPFGLVATCLAQGERPLFGLCRVTAEEEGKRGNRAQASRCQCAPAAAPHRTSVFALVLDHCAKCRGCTIAASLGDNVARGGLHCRRRTSIAQRLSVVCVPHLPQLHLCLSPLPVR
jgi:hypothetical protein